MAQAQISAGKIGEYGAQTIQIDRLGDIGVSAERLGGIQIEAILQAPASGDYDARAA